MPYFLSLAFSRVYHVFCLSIIFLGNFRVIRKGIPSSLPIRETRRPSCLPNALRTHGLFLQSPWIPWSLLLSSTSPLPPLALSCYLSAGYLRALPIGMLGALRSPSSALRLRLRIRTRHHFRLLQLRLGRPTLSGLASRASSKRLPRPIRTLLPPFHEGPPRCLRGE